MITTVTGSGLRCRGSLPPQRRATDNVLGSGNAPANAQESGEPTVTVRFTSLVLLAIFLVFACAVVAALLVR